MGLVSPLLPGETLCGTHRLEGHWGPPHQQPPAPAGRGVMGKGQRWPLSMAMLAQAHLLTGLASLTRGTSGARQTLGRKKRSDEPPQMWVTKGDEERDNISPTLGGLSPCEGRGQASPGSQEHQQDLVHLFLQRDPGGDGTRVRRGQWAPELLLQWPSTAMSGHGLVDTHSRAGRTLGTSFTVFASSTLWKRRRGCSEHGPDLQPGGAPTGLHTPPRTGRGAGCGRSIFRRTGEATASCPWPRPCCPHSRAAGSHRAGVPTASARCHPRPWKHPRLGHPTPRPWHLTPHTVVELPPRAAWAL